MGHLIKIARPKEAIVTREIKEKKNVTHLMEKGEGLRGSAGVKEGETLEKVKRKEASQRINAKELVYLLGLLESDGSIMCYLEKGKKGKVYLRGEVAVGLKEEDIKLCYWIREKLGCGTVRKVKHSKDKERNVSRYQLRSKELINELIIKSFEKYPPLTENKKRSVEWFKSCYEKNVLIPKDKIKVEEIKVNKENMEDWIVGFIEGDGSFYVNKNGVAGFNIVQKGEEEMMEFIRRTMGIKRELGRKKNGMIDITAESKEDIKRVLNFMTAEERVKLKGLKKVKFLLWLRYLRRTDKELYKGLRIPEIY